MLSLLTFTNLIVHESLQALDEFMLVPFINIFLPEKTKLTQWLHEQNLELYKWHVRDVIGDHSLFLVQQLLQSIQKQAKTLMTKVINPTRKKTNTHKNELPNAVSKLLLPCWFIVSHVDSAKEANTSNIVLTSEEISHSN